MFLKISSDLSAVDRYVRKYSTKPPRRAAVFEVSPSPPNLASGGSSVLYDALGGSLRPLASKTSAFDRKGREAISKLESRVAIQQDYKIAQVTAQIWTQTVLENDICMNCLNAYLYCHLKKKSHKNHLQMCPKNHSKMCPKEHQKSKKYIELPPRGRKLFI